MNSDEMQCEIKSGVCCTVVTTIIYKQGGRYHVCENCYDAIQRGDEIHPTISPWMADTLELYKSLRAEPANGQARHVA
jgi:hypothetical protein